jgi:signal transduction histidine kinase
MVIANDYTLLSTTVRIANSTNLSHAARLKSLARFIEKSFDLDSVDIYLLDTDHRTLGWKISSQGPEQKVSCSIPVGEGAAGLCVLRKDTVYAGTCSLHGDETLTSGAAETRALPLTCGKRVVGALSLALTKTSVLDRISEKVFQDIMTEIAGLVYSAEITERSDRRIQHLITLNELGKVLHQPIPFREILPFILKIAHEYTASSCTVLRIFNYDVFTSKVLRTCERRHRAHLRSMLEIEQECSGRMLLTGTPLLIIDVVGDEDLPPSYVSVPLHYEAQTFGMLTFFGKTERDGGRRNFDEEDRELFEGMGNLISGALVGVRNFRRMTMLTDENINKLKKLSLLYRISNALHSTTRINKLINLSLTALISDIPPLFERAMLFLVNKRSGMMQGMFGVTAETRGAIPQSTEEDGESLGSLWNLSDEDMERLQSSTFCCMVKGTRIQLDMSRDILSRAVLEKRLILASHTEKKSPPTGECFDKFTMTSFAAVPLVAKNEVVALVIIDNPLTAKPIGREDQELLHLFANQTGMAIENAMLYNRIENSNREFGEIRQRLLQGERLASLGETAASIAHELKGPLVSIGGLARRLLRKEAPGSSDWKYADTIAREANRLEKMLDEILVFTKRATICYTVCPLETAVTESLAIVSGITEEKRIRVKKRFSSAPLQILGDFQQLKQVCINLFNNACEAMKPGGTLFVSVTSTVLDGKEAVALKVRDTGGGIPPEILPNIFSPFYTTKEGGTGLGLPIVHRIVTNHGGTIQAGNRSGIGAEFRVILPAHPYFPPFQQEENPV